MYTKVMKQIMMTYLVQIKIQMETVKLLLLLVIILRIEEEL